VSEIDFLSLTRELCSYRTGVVAEGNEGLFKRISREIPLRLHRYRSGLEHLGWQIPQLWRVKEALIKRDGKVVFNGSSDPLGVAMYSNSFRGEIDLSELKKHVVTLESAPDAYVFHCQWQYRPWDPGWAFCVPHRVFQTFGPGKYQIELETTYAPGEMLVADSTKEGSSPDLIVFQSNSCHPHMANDGFAGTAVMIRFFQWLQSQNTHYSYRLVIGPEHIGTVFYLAGMNPAERGRFISGVFGEMMGTPGPAKLASTFLGNQIIDRAFRNTLQHHAKDYRFVPWRKSVGNDETVWEAPGYEIPFVQINRAGDSYPFPEYHTNLDCPDLMDPAQLREFYDLFQRVVFVLEHNRRMKRTFDGIVCLSNPKYALYHERPDPAVAKDLSEDAEKWGYLNDCILRYFDGRHTILDIAERHDLPFEPLYNYVKQFEEKGLITTEFDPIRKPGSS
jgi:aminopeptidase-like protein